MQIKNWLIMGALLGACNSSSPTRIESKSQAAIFPASSSWRELTRFGAKLTDTINDFGNGPLELVGDSNFGVVAIYSDGDDFFVRLRLDANPSGAGTDVVALGGWGLEFELNRNLDDYELLLLVDGTSPGANQLVFAQNTLQSTLGSTADPAEVVLSASPLVTGVGGNIAISLANSNFNGTPDYFLDFAIPMTELGLGGLDLSTSVNIIAGTSSMALGLNGDLMSCDNTTGACSITTSHSDSTFLTGDRADPDRDTFPSPVDLDDENDGILDTDENPLGVDPDADVDGDGIPNWRDGDNQGDGSSTCIDADGNGFCERTGPRFDGDGDGVPNHLDVDSDNDGIVDLFECGHGATDAAGDGIVDGFVGNNGFVDQLETSPDSGIATYILLDTDGDGIQNHHDLDSDGDGIFDLDEIGGGALDADNSGRVDSSVDAEFDGLMASVDFDEAAQGFPGIDPRGFDPDADTIPDAYDADDAGPSVGDSDTDGADDAVECAGAWPACADADSNGHPDYMRPGICGDGLLNAFEGCDDANGANGDGCSSLCLVENNNACNGIAPGNLGDASCASGNCDTLGNTVPGMCEPLNACGNGILDAPEGCDDGNVLSGDGCSAACLIEDGGACNATNPGALGDPSCASGNCDTLGNAAPGVCEPLNACGNGILDATEGCDDGNVLNGDGCSAVCLIEDGGACNATNPGALGDPSCASGNCDTLGNAAAGVCEPLNACGNGILEAGEGCDDGGVANGDGCSAVCLIEDGGACNATNPGALGDPSCASGNCDTLGNAAAGVCESLNACGNGILEAGEGCDDGGVANGDGCSASCFIENGGACNATNPGTLGNPSCESGICNSLGNAAPGICEGANNCGNGLIEVNEGCDDGAQVDGDGCAATCLVEPGAPCNQTAPGLIGDSSCQLASCDLSGGAPGICNGYDSDGDGIFDRLDLDDDNDGILDADEGVETAVDSDGDGIVDALDLDSDNDGVLDVTEAGHSEPDSNADGQVSCSSGFGANGFCDALETSPESGVADYDGDGVVDAPVDTDSDGLPNFQDLDTDNDGISDLRECDSGCSDVSPADERCDGGDADADGIADSLDDRTGFGDDGYLLPPDTDSDGAADYLDLDADNDGLSDVVEGDSGCLDTSPWNAVCDGPDSDGDGLVDDSVGTPPDTDGDGIDDYRDLDSDDDGVSDRDEGGSGCEDGNNNEVCDGPDGDGDGIADSIDDTVGHGDETPQTPTDDDGDGTSNAYDLDSNGDGTNDSDESGCVDSAPDDGVCDGEDSDGDGIVDDVDGSDDFGTGNDLDGDGVDDFIDLDDDNDGILDVDEGDASAVDTDGDGVRDSRDLDSDNDSVLDSVEANHGLGTVNGMVNCPSGVGGNGFCDDLETSPDSAVADYNGDGVGDELSDQDGDTVPDFRDLDTDGDTVADAQESGVACADNEVPTSVCDGSDSDGDGIVDGIDTRAGFGAGVLGSPVDTDRDGTPDYRDLDSDDDTIPDIVEAVFGAIDTDDDGVSDDSDSDGDGLSDSTDDSVDFGGGPPSLDTDEDGTPDYRDLDADGDGWSDTEEAGENPNEPVDTDGDGAPDFQDVDSDGDTVGDATDNCRFTKNSDQRDLDGNGVGSACQDGFEFGVQGGGCNSSGQGRSGSWSLLLLLLAFAIAFRNRLASKIPGITLPRGDVRCFSYKKFWGARHRAPKSGPLGVGLALLLASLLAGVGTADAQRSIETNYPIERFRLSSDPSGILDVEWGAVTGYKVLDLGMWMGWANDPLTISQTASSGERTRVGSLISSRMAGNLIGSIGIARRFQLGIEVPLVLYQGQDIGDFMTGTSAPTSFGLGDLRLVPKVGLLRQEDSGVSIAVNLGFTLPTSSSKDYYGEAVAFSPQLLVSRSFASGLRLATNLGVALRTKVTVVDLVVDDELQAKVGIGYNFAEQGGVPLELDATFSLATALDNVLGAYNRNYSEVKLGASYQLSRTLTVFGASGVGIAEGFGTPDWRVLSGLRFRKDAGAKALVDSDGDGILDMEDPCPMRAENLNGYEDEDGCPDSIPDTDKDGFNDLVDSCPRLAEDIDSFEDEDGCPDLDNDHDKIVDVEDACPDVPGVLAARGCPDPDRDGDSVVDRLDNCPDVPGEVDFQGCERPQLVTITDSSIEILDIVYFRTDKAIIRQISYPMLDNVAEVMKAHSGIGTFRIEGHTDSRNTSAYNKALSQARADSVRIYLISKGVEGARLEAIGFGEAKPIADNGTAKGRAANRRVVFNIVNADPQQVGIESQSSGPTADTVGK